MEPLKVQKTLIFSNENVSFTLRKIRINGNLNLKEIQ